MGLIMRVKSGPLAGREFDLKPGNIIGRADVDIHLNDQKISGRHARIDEASDGALVMVDLGSTNGLRVKDKRLAQVRLSDGISMLIGKTEVEIVARDSAPPVPKPQRDNAAAPNEGFLPPIPGSSEVTVAPVSWADYFADFLSGIRGRVKNRPTPLAPLDPILVLSFDRGPQAGTVWEVGYGPRHFGLAGFEFSLLDPKAPKKAFTISPKGHAPQIQTDHPKEVLLNGKPVSSETLKDGDVISIAETQIRVSFKE